VKRAIIGVTIPHEMGSGWQGARNAAQIAQIVSSIESTTKVNWS